MNADITIRESQSTGKLYAALIAAQIELENPPKNSVNPHYKSRYADLATVRDTVLPVLLKHGLAVTQLPCELNGEAALASRLIHTSGEWLETVMRLRPSKTDPQGVGSALTYMRRYQLQSIAGVAAEDDDDGNAGSRPAKQPAVRPDDSAIITDAEATALDDLVRRAEKPWQRLVAWMRAEAFPDLAEQAQSVDLTRRQARWLTARLNKALEKKTAKV